MMGYAEVTWYGYMGWGASTTLSSSPDATPLIKLSLQTTTLSFIGLNLVSRAQMTWNVQPVNSPFGKGSKTQFESPDLKGLLFDRDIVAFYGDPAWKAKMAEGKKNWVQTLSRNGDRYSFVITPSAGPQSYMPVNQNGVQRGYRPFIQFFEGRLGKVQVVSGSEYEPIITDTFILVPNPSSRKAKEIKIVFQERD